MRAVAQHSKWPPVGGGIKKRSGSKHHAAAGGGQIGQQLHTSTWFDHVPQITTPSPFSRDKNDAFSAGTNIETSCTFSPEMQKS